MTNRYNLLSICCKIKCRLCSNGLYLFCWLTGGMNTILTMPFISQNFDWVGFADILSFLGWVYFVLSSFYVLCSYLCCGTWPEINPGFIVRFDSFPSMFTFRCSALWIIVFHFVWTDLPRFTTFNSPFAIFLKLSLILIYYFVRQLWLYFSCIYTFSLLCYCFCKTTLLLKRFTLVLIHCTSYLY